LLKENFKCRDPVPSINEADAQTTEINRLLHEVMAKIQEIELRHFTVTADDAGNPVVAVRSWNDEAEPVILQLVEDLLSVTTPEQADFIARYFAAPALGDWGKGRRDFAILDWDGTGQFGILRQDPFPSGDDAPTREDRLNFSRWKESIESRYSHILPYFQGIDG